MRVCVCVHVYVCALCMCVVYVCMRVCARLCACVLMCVCAYVYVRARVRAQIALGTGAVIASNKPCWLRGQCIMLEVGEPCQMALACKSQRGRQPRRWITATPQLPRGGCSSSSSSSFDSLSRMVAPKLAASMTSAALLLLTPWFCLISPRSLA